MLTASILSSAGDFIGLSAGIVVVLGFVGGGFKFIRASGAADERRSAEAAAQHDQMVSLAEQVEALTKLVTPNGRDTDRIGDMVARTEDSVKALSNAFIDLSAQFREHLGVSKVEHAQMRRDIARKVDKV